MPNLSWNEIQDRATEFASKWHGENYEKGEIAKLGQSVLEGRAEFPDSSLVDLYDPLTMSPSLTKAHKAFDRAVDRLYSPKPFATDADRVAMLFEKYHESIHRA